MRGVARYNEDGSLDTTFGVGGLVRTDFGVDTMISDDENDKAAGVVIIDDDIFVAGHAFNLVTGEDFALANYNSEADDN